MKSVSKCLCSVVLVLIFGGGLVLASDGGIPWPFPYDLRMISQSKMTGQVTLEVKVACRERYGPCDSVKVQISGSPGLHWIGPDSLVLVKLTPTFFPVVLQLTVPPAETSMVRLDLQCPGHSQFIKAFFVSTGDSIELWGGDPRGLYPYSQKPPEGPPSGNARPGEFPINDSLWGTIQLVPSTLPKRPGASKVRLRFAPARHPCDSLRFKVSGINGLQIAGDHVWTARMIDAVPYERELDISVPANDTSGIRVELLCGGLFHQLEQYFAASDSGVTYFAWDQLSHRWRPRNKESERTATPIERLRQLYPGPLTGSTSQSIHLDGKEYIRYEGETDFEEQIPVSGDLRAHARVMQDSAGAIPLTAKFDIVLVVADSNELAKARAIVTDCCDAGTRDGNRLYNCRITKEAIGRLQEQGVKFYYRTSSIRPIRDTSLPSQDRGGDSSSTSRANPVRQSNSLTPQASTIFSDDFDGLWPGSWTAGDIDPFGGFDFWGPSTYEYHSFPRSVWCSGDGDMVDGSHYDVWQVSTMDLAIDVRDYADLTLDYWIWYDISSSFDAFAVRYSYDSLEWYYIDQLQGNSGGWQSVHHGWLMRGGPTLFLQFSFVSGGTPKSNRGVYLDDVLMTGELKANLAPYTPPGWSGPLVVSTTPGSTQTTNLYEGEEAFISIAETNYGPGTSRAHTSGLLLNGHPLGQTPLNIPEMEMGYYYSIQGITFLEDTVTAGSRDLKLLVDNADGVDESYESDNTWTGQFQWRQPRLPTLVTCTIPTRGSRDR